jgi:hypothetical protein
MNRIESKLRHVKTLLNPYNRSGNYVYQIVHYTLAASCRCENVDRFRKFIDIVASTDCSVSLPPHPLLIRMLTNRY